MTDNKNNTMKIAQGNEPLVSMGNEPLVSMDDEKLLESFFADCRMDIPDDGFSDKVMAALPSVESQETRVASMANRRLEHLWTAACVIVGLVSLFVFRGMDYLKDSLFAFKISFLTNGSRILSKTVDAFAHSANLWMMLLGVGVLVVVWGYNELMDAR